MVYFVIIAFLILGFLVGFILGALTVMGMRFMNDKRKIKKKHSFENKYEQNDFIMDKEVLKAARTEQAANEYK